jgi:hypothetical protein
MNIMLRCLYGSRLYGTATPGSDYDYRLITLPAISDLLLAKKIEIEQVERDIQHIPVQVFVNGYETGQAYAVELAWHVAENYFTSELILDCHPEFHSLCVELTEVGPPPLLKMVAYARAMAYRYVNANRRLNSLKQLKERLLNYDVKSSINYALCTGLDLSGLESVISYSYGDSFLMLLDGKHSLTAQLSQLVLATDNALKRLFNGARVTGTAEDWKSMHHALRVAYQAIELKHTRKLQIPLHKDTANWLLDVKLGKIPYDSCARSLEEMIAGLEGIQENSLDCSNILLPWLKKMYKV